MEKIERELFFQLTAHFEVVPFTQSAGWVDFNASGKKRDVVYLVDNSNDPQIGCLAHVKKAGCISMLLIESECLAFKQIDEEQIGNFYKSIRQLPYPIIEINSTLEYSPEIEAAIRQAGFLRPCGLFSTPLTIQVDFNETISYNRNWLRNLKKASSSELLFKKIQTVSVIDIQRFVEMYNEMAVYKVFPYRLTTLNVQNLFKDPSMHLFQVEDGKGDICAMRIVHIHKAFATDVFAANSIRSRENAASYMMIQSLFAFLKSEGCSNFDFGRILPGHKGTDSVARFKSGVHGKSVVYLGEWSWYKYSIFRPMMYFVKKYLMKKTEV